jgi:hypothetical protein
MNRHAEFALNSLHAFDLPAAPNPHVLAQRDLGGHHQRQLDSIAFGNLEIGVEKNSAAAQILSEAVAFTVTPGQADRHRQLEIETLRGTALKVNLIGAHDFSCSRFKGSMLEKNDPAKMAFARGRNSIGSRIPCSTN